MVDAHKYLLKKMDSRQSARHNGVGGVREDLGEFLQEKRLSRDLKNWEEVARGDRDDAGGEGWGGCGRWWRSRGGGSLGGMGARRMPWERRRGEVGQGVAPEAAEATVRIRISGPWEASVQSSEQSSQCPRLPGHKWKQRMQRD